MPLWPDQIWNSRLVLRLGSLAKKSTFVRLDTNVPCFGGARVLVKTVKSDRECVLGSSPNTHVTDLCNPVRRLLRVSYKMLKANLHG